MDGQVIDIMGKAIAFIPVRGGSTSSPLQNIKPMCGKPLLYWTAAAADGCRFIDEVVIATDSSEIARVAGSMGLAKVRVVGRGAETATNTATTESAMIEYAKANEFDVMVLVQATSPLLTSDDLDKGFDQFAKPEVDSVVSVVEDFRFYWRPVDRAADAFVSEPANYDVYARPRRQDFDGCYMENGAFYISRREDVLQSGNRVSGNIAVSVMPPDTSFEIDEPEDWTIVEALLRRKMSSAGAIDFDGVKMVLTDCDGCLTDGGMYYSESGEELKKFNTRDGMAFQLLREAGILTGMITGESSQAALRRAKKLKMDFVEIGCADKLDAVTKICEESGIGLSEVAYVGDDLNDIELLDAVGVPCCPADARPEVRERARFVSGVKGGQGVIRDVVSKILS
ncbi:MAG: N-acylneuraminate cytidylyltransferase [Eggerthellaceae bacterium]|nr:N-acylneuraminate cytidylyltransferase [Eggerthellaceae bacterium]